MKNHRYVNGCLLQMNKTFSMLKESQKCKISEWMYESYRKYRLEAGKIPNGDADELIIQFVLSRIEAATIWIPEGEIYHHYERKKVKLEKRFEREQARIAERQSDNQEIIS